NKGKVNTTKAPSSTHVLLRLTPRRSILREGVVRVAEQPPLPALRRGDHRVPGLPRVPAGVTVGRAVTAAGTATLLTGAQMDPPGTDLHEILARMPLGPLLLADRTDVAADPVRHVPPSDSFIR